MTILLATTNNEEVRSAENVQNVGFSDSKPGFTVAIESAPDSTYNIGNYEDAKLGDFLSRPIRIGHFEWLMGANINEAFNPWTLFFSNPAVKKRIDNFARLRCKLHVKFVINATPFHYGRAIVSYQPWHAVDSADLLIIGSQENLVLYSQRPKVFINPTANEGGTIILPFFHFDNWIDTQDASQFSDMGILDLNSFSVLKHASGGTERVSITVFAWAEEVDLCVPTVRNAESIRMAPQSGSKKTKKSTTGSKKGGKDEYSGEGVISKPATALASIAGALEVVPMLAPFAMATRMGATTVANIAKMFGYSRPAILEKPEFYKPQYASNLATCDAPETVSKLTVDSKQELTIDPRTTGLSGQDELSIAYIAKKETFLTQFPWKTGDPDDALLFTVEVAPMLEHIASPGIYFPTALSFATFPFAFWSGTIKFRFQVICSDFHHGRLIFSYEPTATASETQGEFNTVYTEIIDIGEENDFELDVSWTGEVPYRSTGWNRTYSHSYIGDLGGSVFSDKFSNGIITVRVLNDLNAPADDADVDINVFISAGDDFELCNPNNTNIKNSAHFFPQSGTGGQVATGTDDNPEEAIREPFVGSADVSAIQDKNSIFFGETIVTFRTLLRRYNKFRSWSWPPNHVAETNLATTRIIMPFKPISRGYDTNGVDRTSTEVPYNYVNTTLLSYLMPAYVGYRGSLRSKFRPRSDNILQLDVQRGYNLDGDLTGRNVPLSRSTIAAGTGRSNAAFRGALDDAYMTGGVIFPATQQPIAEVEYPFMSGKRFAFARNVGQNSLQDNSISMENYVESTYVSAASPRYITLDEYRSVGEDFNLFFFLNAPTRYEYADPAPSDTS